MTDAYIYALCCPDTGDVRYVGMTLRPKVRLQQHYADVSPSLKVKWIKELRACGKRPVMTILEMCPANERYVTERRWIGLVQRQGITLLNGLPDLEQRQRRHSTTWVRPLTADERQEARLEGEIATLYQCLQRLQAAHERSEALKVMLRIKLAAAESILDEWACGKRTYGVVS